MHDNNFMMNWNRCRCITFPLWTFIFIYLFLSSIFTQRKQEKEKKNSGENDKTEKKGQNSSEKEENYQEKKKWGEKKRQKNNIKSHVWSLEKAIICHTATQKVTHIMIVPYVQEVYLLKILVFLLICSSYFIFF